MEKYSIVELYLPSKKITRYIKNIQSIKGKASIYYKDEKDNPYDSEAIAIFTKDKQKNEIFLGYIKKNNVEKEYTFEANELYHQATMGEIAWEVARDDENWNQYTIVKTPIWTSEDLEKIKDLINQNFYNYRFSYEENNGYLFKKES